MLEERVAATLHALPRDRWLVERYVIVDGYRIPFVVFGECGIFVILAVSRRPQWSDTAYAHDLAGFLKGRLTDYGGPVTPGICGVFETGMKPRFWQRTEAHGGSWIMGLDWLIAWMEHFGHEHGLGVKDIERLDQLAGPHWSRPVKPGPPPVPDLDAEIRGHG